VGVMQLIEHGAPRGGYDAAHVASASLGRSLVVAFQHGGSKYTHAGYAKTSKPAVILLDPAQQTAEQQCRIVELAHADEELHTRGCTQSSRGWQGWDTASPERVVSVWGGRVLVPFGRVRGGWGAAGRSGPVGR
jgi:S-formylglutathione hydrolase FrmB